LPAGTDGLLEWNWNVLHGWTTGWIFPLRTSHFPSSPSIYLHLYTCVPFLHLCYILYYTLTPHPLRRFSVGSAPIFRGQKFHAYISLLTFYLFARLDTQCCNSVFTSVTRKYIKYGTTASVNFETPTIKESTKYIKGVDDNLLRPRQPHGDGQLHHIHLASHPRFSFFCWFFFPVGHPS